jgi:hypothetical protein
MREETKKSTLNLFYSAFFFILYPKKTKHNPKPTIHGVGGTASVSEVNSEI